MQTAKNVNRLETWPGPMDLPLKNNQNQNRDFNKSKSNPCSQTKRSGYMGEVGVRQPLHRHFWSGAWLFGPTCG